MDTFDGVLWFSISHMSWNPYTPSFFSLQLSSDPCHAADGNDIALQSQGGRFLREFQALALLRRDAEWSVQFYRLKAGARPILNFVPGNQIVCPLTDVPVGFWPLRSGGARAGRREAVEDEGVEDGPAPPAEDPFAILDGDHIEPESDAEPGPPPPPPPPPPHGGAPRVFAGRMAATASVTFGVEGHTISFYASDGRFEAVCRNVHHLPTNRCRMTRSLPAVDDGVTTRGRVLGLLAAWLLLDHVDLASREDHCNPFIAFTITHAERADARDFLKTQDGAEMLFASERLRRPGEPEEPLLAN
jgi:hypothetical protein